MADNDRKIDDGTAGPRPHGLRQGEMVEELEARQSFLRHVHAKVVRSPKQDKPKGIEHAAKTKNRIERAREATHQRVAMGRGALGE